MRLLPFTLLFLSGSYAVSTPTPSGSRQQPGIKRTILQRADAPGSATHEIVLAIAEFPPGGTSGWHRHPGVEMAYVLEGTIVMQIAGRSDTTLVAGNSIQNHVPHTARNAGTTVARVLATYVVEKGKPLAEPVPAP